jgi:predicted amidophosphoribosyltransferase
MVSVDVRFAAAWIVRLPGRWPMAAMTSGLRALVHLLKYNGVRPAAKVLGRMLADAMVALEPSFAQAGWFDQGSTAVIPVPLYKAKRRQRGFNQAELIARAALRFYPARPRLQPVPDLCCAPGTRILRSA